MTFLYGFLTGMVTLYLAIGLFVTIRGMGGYRREDSGWATVPIYVKIVGGFAVTFTWPWFLMPMEDN